MDANDLTAIVAGVLVAATLKNISNPAALSGMNQPEAIDAAVQLARAIVLAARGIK